MQKKAVSSTLISSLKTIVAKTKRRFFGASSWRQSDDKISFSEATDIQKEAFAKSLKRNLKSQRTPPYLELSAQLLAEETQIFTAAANHLVAIAKSRRKYAPEIKAIFAEIIANRRLSDEKLTYINNKIKELNTYL